MTHQFSCHFQLLFVAALFALCGCEKGTQDEGEIPAVIGRVQDAEKTTTAKAEQLSKPSESTSPLETTKAPATQKSGAKDLATILKQEKAEFEKQAIEIPDSWKRMSKDNHIWADKENKRVIIRGMICLDHGLLEMFACPRDTKEHEAIVSVHAKAWEAHATMVALGINPGKPMLWYEEYYPVSGPVMNVDVWWTDEQGNVVKKRAQDLILNRDTGKPMECDFVFGGSEQLYDPYTKKNDYLADMGPMINVANQPDAMIDVSIESSDAAQGSLFEANTANLPPVNTKVYIVLSDSGKRIKSTITPEVEEKIKRAMERREPPGYEKPDESDKVEAEKKVDADKEEEGKK
jgi:hypothetical protein